MIGPLDQRRTLIWRKPLKHDRLWPLVGNSRPRMTVCIVSKAPANDFIVAVSDTRLIQDDGLIQAIDPGAIKQIKISRHWGIMAASNDWTNVRPIFTRVVNLMKAADAKESLDYVQYAVSTAYRQVFLQKVEGAVLCKYGIASYKQFEEMLSTSPSPAISEIKKDIDQLDLETSILVYGIDPFLHFACSFEVRNPGEIVELNHTFIWSIGSGCHMAMASLTAVTNVEMTEESIIYRAIEAKFAAESAEGVGQNTTVVVLYDDGSVRFLMDSDVQELRKIWEADRRRSIPQEASEELKKQLKARPRWPWAGYASP
jgi:hypothetical protein